VEDLNVAVFDLRSEISRSTSVPVPKYASITFGSSLMAEGGPSRSGSVFENDDSLAGPHDEAHVVLDEEDGDLPVTDLPDEVDKQGRLLLVHPAGRLVEDDEAGSVARARAISSKR